MVARLTQAQEFREDLCVIFGQGSRGLIMLDKVSVFAEVLCIDCLLNRTLEMLPNDVCGKFGHWGYGAGLL